MSDQSQSPQRPGQPPADIFDRLDSAVLIVDDRGRIRYANAPAVRLLNRPRAEIMSTPMLALLPPRQSFLGAACQAVLDMRRTTTTFGWDAVIETWVGVRAYATPGGAELHIRTIPAAAGEQGADAVSSTEPAVPLEAIAIPMLIIDAHGVIQFVNQAATEMLGYQRGDLAGRSLASLLLDQKEASALIERLTTASELSDIEVEMLAADGATRDVQITTGTHEPAIAQDAVQCFLRDVSELRAREEREARLAALVESSDDAIISKRLDGIITSWNPGAERMYGYSSEEAVGKPITLIFPEDREDDFHEIMARLARGKRIDHYETVRRTKDGRLLDISVSISPVRNAAGRIVGAATIARDITERRMLERKQREFLTMVAHDLRSPLTSIKGFAQLMQRRETYSPSGVAAILSQVEHMERLVGDVLDITRIDENRHDLTLTETDLTALARTIVDHANTLRASGTVRLVAPEAPVVGTWDSARLAQVLDNLVDNALKYAPDGEITVELTPGDNGVTVDVVDRGPGIAPSHLPHIFTRFYRTPGDSAMGRGVGLGLAIARGLIEAQGGTIEATSTVGEGTRFRITLPWMAQIDTRRRSDLPPLPDD